jgi:hypothetical protein
MYGDALLFNELAWEDEKNARQCMGILYFSKNSPEKIYSKNGRKCLKNGIHKHLESCMNFLVGF